jgi:hypothetical protein
VEVVEDQHRATCRDRRQLPDEGIDHGLARRATDCAFCEQGGGLGCEARIVLTARRDEVVHDGQPVAVVVVESVPQRSRSAPPREIGEERGLAVTGVGQDEDDAAVDLRPKPIEQTWSGERLVA